MKKVVMLFAIIFVIATIKVELAISYTVNGRTYWDNNFGANYISEGLGYITK